MQYARVLRTCYALTMQYARAMPVPCSSHACAPARTMRYARAIAHTERTRCARAMHVHLRIPCDMHVIRTCHALTGDAQNQGIYALNCFEEMPKHIKELQHKFKDVAIHALYKLRNTAPQIKEHCTF